MLLEDDLSTKGDDSSIKGDELSGRGEEGYEGHLSVKGVLLKRKDFLELDEDAQSHPNRTYYFRREEEGTIDTCTRAIEVSGASTPMDPSQTIQSTTLVSSSPCFSSFSPPSSLSSSSSFPSTPSPTYQCIRCVKAPVLLCRIPFLTCSSVMLRVCCVEQWP